MKNSFRWQTNKAFVLSSALEKHKKIHWGVTPFECQFCNKPFVHSQSLKQHLRIHTGERPFECQLCDKRLNTKRDLLVHERGWHSGKEFKCKYWFDQLFDQKTKLKIHERSHEVKMNNFDQGCMLNIHTKQ